MNASTSQYGSVHVIYAIGLTYLSCKVLLKLGNVTVIICHIVMLYLLFMVLVMVGRGGLWAGRNAWVNVASIGGSLYRPICSIMHWGEISVSPNKSKAFNINNVSYVKVLLSLFHYHCYNYIIAV